MKLTWMQEFSTHLEVKATPTFFLNGKQIDKLVGANKPEPQKTITIIVDSQVVLGLVLSYHLQYHIMVLSNFVFSFSIISVLTSVTTLYNSGQKFVNRQCWCTDGWWPVGLPWLKFVVVCIIGVPLQELEKMKTDDSFVAALLAVFSAASSDIKISW
ncbi:hypothetical protein L1987_49127 [Smallanthus sonchifolius]|uniref:Uncharacterized protein n=1 Tax=Smallanthus sonchifolius TaxID=185202 RepID=A0ACB9FUH0_9ASTR|nr:hypothetical protein L1987_49127 [Smallanthus sonchifolius]